MISARMQGSGERIMKEDGRRVILGRQLAEVRVGALHYDIEYGRNRI